MHATRAIPAGEAITISYVDLLSPPFARQATLLQTHNFLCACPRCATPAVAGSGHACLWTVRRRPYDGSHAMLDWRLERSDGSVQEHLAKAAAEAGGLRSGVVAAGTASAADGGASSEGDWHCSGAVHDAAHATHHVNQVLKSPDVRPAVLHALKRQLKVRPGAPVLPLPSCDMTRSASAVADVSAGITITRIVPVWSSRLRIHAWSGLALLLSLMRGHCSVHRSARMGLDDV